MATLQEAILSFNENESEAPSLGSKLFAAEHPKYTTALEIFKDGEPISFCYKDEWMGWRLGYTCGLMSATIPQELPRLYAQGTK